MRRFADPRGVLWEVVAGRESWGTIVALFIPVNPGEQVRQAPLLASSYEEANLELAALDDRGLATLLEKSSEKSME